MMLINWDFQDHNILTPLNQKRVSFSSKMIRSKSKDQLNHGLDKTLLKSTISLMKNLNFRLISFDCNPNGNSFNQNPLCGVTV